MATSTYQLGAFAFRADVARGLQLTDVDLNAFSADILGRMNSMVPGAVGLLAGTGTPGMAQTVTLGAGFSLVNGTLNYSGGVTYTAIAPLAINGAVVSLAQSGATAGQVLAWSGSAWAPATVNAGNAPISGITIDGSTIPATTSSPYQMQTADRVVAVNKGTGAATKVFLPISAPLWTSYRIIDAKGDADTNNITVSTTGTINGLAMLIIQNKRGVLDVLQTAANTWSIV